MSEILSREELKDARRDPLLIHLENSGRVVATIDALAEELEWARCPLTNERYEYLAKDEVNRSRELREKGWLHDE